MIYRIADRVSIIDMREAHIRAVMDILAASYSGPSLWTESQLHVAWSGHNTLIKVARFDGLIAGVIVMRAFRNGVEIRKLAVMPRIRRCGVGTELMRAARARLDFQRYELRAEAETNQKPGMMFLQHHGFIGRLTAVGEDMVKFVHLFDSHVAY